MKAGDFSVPRRMSGSAYVVLLAKALRQYAGVFIIFVIIKVFDSDRQHPLMEAVGIMAVIAAGFIALAAVSAFFSYYFKKYYIEDGRLVFIHGLFSKETTSIPLDRVQSLRTRQGLVYRILEMRGVLFDTLASESSEIELILDERDWNALLCRVETQERPHGDEGPEAEETDDGEEAGGISARISFSNLNLVKGALCQNHLQGAAVLFAALAAVFNAVSTMGDYAVEHVIGYVGTHAGSMSSSPSFWIAVAVVLYLVIMLMWIGKVFLRYYDMEVRMGRGLLVFESGLLARTSNRFRHDKVCTVCVKRNFLEKRMNGSTVMLRQALNASDEKNGTDVKIYGSDSAADFLGWWLGKDYGASPEIASARSGYGLMVHVAWPGLLLALAASAVLAWCSLYAWIALPAVYMLIPLSRGFLAVRRSRVTLKEDYVAVSDGKFADNCNYIKYSNVEVVRLVSTPFTPYFRRVKLILSTNGSTFTVRSLREQEAVDIYELLLDKCSSGRTGGQ